MDSIVLKTSIITVLLTFFLLAWRLITILPPFRPRPTPRKRLTSPTSRPTHLLIVLGSGGHTAEMLFMLENAIFGSPSSKTGKAAPGNDQSERCLDWSLYSHRTWVVSSGDAFSALRAAEFEARIAHAISADPDKSTDRSHGQYRIVFVPRARKIHQSLLTAPLSCFRCGMACWTTLLGKDVHQPGETAVKTSSERWPVPDLILCNGPATATVLVIVSVLMRFLGTRGATDPSKLRTVYVESWARIKRLSLSGRLLCRIVDRMLVQWEGLSGAGGGRAEYHGALCI